MFNGQSTLNLLDSWLLNKLIQIRIKISVIFGSTGVMACWNVLEVCGVSSWVEVGGPAPPRTSLGSAWPHCLGPTLPTIASGPQDTGLHSALCRYTYTTLLSIHSLGLSL